MHAGGQGQCFEAPRVIRGVTKGGWGSPWVGRPPAVGPAVTASRNCRHGGPVRPVGGEPAGPGVRAQAALQLSPAVDYMRAIRPRSAEGGLGRSESVPPSAGSGCFFAAISLGSSLPTPRDADSLSLASAPRPSGSSVFGSNPRSHEEPTPTLRRFPFAGARCIRVVSDSPGEVSVTANVRGANSTA